MKKIFVIIPLLLCFLFASCVAPADNSNGGTDSTPAESAKYVFEVAAANDFEISIDQNMADVLENLGEPLKYFEAASCAFDGLDKTYTYAGFVITTRPDGEKDYVNSILLTDDSVTTPEGLYIGANTDAVTAAYGTPDQQTETLMSYVSGATALNFIIQDGAVISIEYIPA